MEHIIKKRKREYKEVNNTSLPTEIWTDIIVPMVQGNCESFTEEGTKCNNPWQFKIGNKIGNCQKYCILHCNKWVDKLFENPYIVVGTSSDGKEIEYETKLVYEFVINIPLNIAKTIIDRNITNEQITIRINSNDSTYSIIYLKTYRIANKLIPTLHKFKQFLCNVLKYDIEYIVKTIWSADPQYDTNVWITDLPITNPKIINKFTRQKSMKWNIRAGMKFVYNNTLKYTDPELDEKEDVVY